MGKQRSSGLPLSASSPSLNQVHLFESSPPSSPPSDRPKLAKLPKSFSTSKLSARAPEFIPRSNSTSSLNLTPPASPGQISVSAKGKAPVAATTQRASFVIPQPPGPPALVHIVATTTPAARVIANPVPLPTAAYHMPVQYKIGGQQKDVAALAVVLRQPVAGPTTTTSVDSAPSSKNGVTDEVSQKILNQVEYYFSDLNVATTDHLIRFMNKDPEGYVPISVVASFKKIKALISSHSQLATILRKSEKLVVSEDGKKVKRVHQLTKSDLEELQSRIVVAENLPEDHCHQTLMKIFSAVGSVKSLRTCQPQTSNVGTLAASRTTKSDGMLVSNKLHCFVEYESIELAEKAVVELNDVNNWRNGLKVRVLLKSKAKSSQARVKKAGHEHGLSCKDSDAVTADDSLQSDTSNELPGDDHHDVEQKKMCNPGRGKGRGRAQYLQANNRASIMGPSMFSQNISINNGQPMINKQPPVPRMPDGTRGFSMGRGKPVEVRTS